jgi:hypothetical protein
MISDLATEKSKQDLFVKLAEHRRVLAAKVERAMAAQQSGRGEAKGTKAPVRPLINRCHDRQPARGHFYKARNFPKFKVVAWPALRRSDVMQRNRSRPSSSLRDRLLSMANLARQKAETYPEGPERERLIKKAEQTERTAAIHEWISMPGAEMPE